MSKPILSICIPTRNRDVYLASTLNSIIKDEYFLSTDDVEIVISDNCSDDNTEELCRGLVEKFPGKFVYKRQETDLHDKNFVEVLKLANGKYAKLNNDTLSFNKNSLRQIVSALSDVDYNAVFFTNRKTQSDFEIHKFKNADEIFNYLTYQCTWIGGLCVKTEAYKNLSAQDRFSNLNFAQIDILARLAQTNGAIVIEGNLMTSFQFSKKGGYNIAEIFGINLVTILNELVNEKLISKRTFDIYLKKLLTEHINPYYFDHNEKFSFLKTGYFKYLFNIYKFKPYFYWNYLCAQLKYIGKFFYKRRKTQKHKEIIFFNVIKIKFNRDKVFAKDWRKQNRHNYTTIKTPQTGKFISVGNYTYGDIDFVMDAFIPSRLHIGNFCSIAKNVKFIASEHNYNALSTYPFKVFMFNWDNEAFSKGDIVIKDDVWIASNSTILSGVTVNQGAVIATGSVVTKDVPPYAIVGGNPAKVIKYRFEPEVIEKLVKFDFSKLSREKAEKIGIKLYKQINKENVDKLLEEFSNVQ